MNEAKTPPTGGVFVILTTVMKKSPWLVVALGTIGLVVGYGAVVFSHDMLARGDFCPFHDAVQHG